MAVLTKEELKEQSVFEPIFKHRFIVKIPNVPSYMVKSYSDIIWLSETQKEEYEIQNIELELYDAQSPSTKKIVFDNIISKGSVIPEISIEILQCGGGVSNTISLKDNKVLSVNMGNGDFAVDEYNTIKLVIKPTSITIH